MIRLDWQTLREAVSVSDLIPIACSYTNTITGLPMLAVTFRVPRDATGFNVFQPDAMLTNPLNGSYDVAIRWNDLALVSLGGMRIWGISSSLDMGVRTLQLELCSPLQFLTLVDGRGINLLPSSAPAIVDTLFAQVESKTGRSGLFAEADTSTLPSRIIQPPPRDQLASSILHDVCLQSSVYLFAPENARGALWRPISELVDRNPSDEFPFQLSNVRVQKRANAPRRLEIQGGVSRVKHRLIDQWADVSPNALATAARTINAATVAGSDGAAEGLAFNAWLQANAIASSIRVIVPRCADWSESPVAVGDSFRIGGCNALLYGLSLSEQRAEFSLIQLS